MKTIISMTGKKWQEVEEYRMQEREKERKMELRQIYYNLLNQWYDGRPSKSNLKQWTIPDVYYTYTKVKEPDYKGYNVVRSSIIPVIKVNGIIGC